jgi:hypothetical protein
MDRTHPEVPLLAELLDADAILGFIDGTWLRSRPAEVQHEANSILSVADLLSRGRRQGRKISIPFGVVVSKTDKIGGGEVDGAMNVLDGAPPPRMAGKEEPYHESLIHLAYLRRRLGSMTQHVGGFAVSTLESLREGGALTDTQVRRLDSEFKPNGRGVDVEAPLRWCLAKARILREV